MEENFSDDEWNNQFKEFFEKFTKFINIDEMMRYISEHPDFFKKLTKNKMLDFGFTIYNDQNGNFKFRPVNFSPIEPRTLTFSNDNSPIVDDPYFEVIYNNKYEIIIIGDVSGFKKEELRVGSKDKQILTVTGENEARKFSKQIDLPKFDEHSVKIKLRNGLLEIKLKTLEEIRQGNQHNIEIR